MAGQYDLPAEKIKIIEENAKRRTALRNEFLKKASDPLKHGHGGTVFDPAFIRYQAMRVSGFDHFKPTPKTISFGVLGVVVPMVSFMWLLYSSRDAKEKLYRTGQVAYKDRSFKFI